MHARVRMAITNLERAMTHLKKVEGKASRFEPIPRQSATARKRQPTKHKMTAAGRRAISLAAKRRWREYRALHT